MKLSIITVNLNHADGLEKTIQSVVSQNWADIEYLVIDGGSKDESVEIIKKYQHQISEWVSEKDKGIYDAMNKGIKKASGEYLWFLNSGDYLAGDDVVSQILQQKPIADIAYGDLYIEQTRCLWRPPTDWNLSKFLIDNIPHPAALIKRKLFAQIGEYNTEWKIAADWEFWLKAILINKKTYQYYPLHLANFEGGGLSSDIATGDKERELILSQLMDSETLATVSCQLARDLHNAEIKCRDKYEKLKVMKLYRGIQKMAKKIIKSK
jgi:glycosyltransferase involved in cell wall biosynthesis